LRLNAAAKTNQVSLRNFSLDHRYSSLKKTSLTNQKIDRRKNQLSEKPPNTRTPIEETDEEKAKKPQVKAGTE